jgi:hypothetical protein
MTRTHNADDLRALIHAGALVGEAYSRAVIRLYEIERGYPVWYIGAAYHGDNLVSERLCCTDQESQTKE